MIHASSHKLFWVSSLGSGLLVALLTLFFVAIMGAGSGKPFLFSGFLGWVIILFGVLLGLSLWAFLRKNKVLSAAFLTGIIWALIFMSLFAALAVLQLLLN